MSGQLTQADVSPHLITGNSEGARSEDGCSENDGIVVTPIRMPVSKLTTVNINQVLASSPITRMAFLPPRNVLRTMILD